MSIKTKISTSQARRLLCKLEEFNLDFSAIFKPRTKGKPDRHITCRFRGNRKATGKPSYDPADKNLFRVYDTEKQDYRNIPVEGLKVIKAAGRTVKVVHDPLKIVTTDLAGTPAAAQQIRLLIASL